MAGRMLGMLVVAVVAVALLVSGCMSMRELVGGLPAKSTPTVARQTVETRWVLVKNPRFGDVPSEPEYIWTEQDKIPWTFTRFLFGKRTVLAPLEILAKYGRPPGGGKISPLQAGADARTDRAAQGSNQSGPRVEARTEPDPRVPDGRLVSSKAESPPSRGYIIFVDTDRVVIDLTAQDGLSPGSLVSVVRDKVPIIHPVTGELLGELTEEVATGKVVEVRERFSVVELKSITSGTEIRVKDRVVPR